MAVSVPESESPDLVAGNLAVGTRLWAAATTFAFLGHSSPTSTSAP